MTTDGQTARDREFRAIRARFSALVARLHDEHQKTVRDIQENAKRRSLAAIKERLKRT